MMNAKNIDFSGRNVAIDIFRALTMLLMIFVNDLWTISNYPEWIGHAKHGQDMLGLADIVFPSFLFVMGMSIPFAIERRFSKGFSGVSTVGHILTRTLALLIMGLFIVNSDADIAREVGIDIRLFRILMVVGFFLVWNTYPKNNAKFKPWMGNTLKAAGIILLLWLAVIYRDPEGGIMQSYWWGILGLIGWAYLFCAIVYVFTRDKLKYLLAVLLILIGVCLLKTPMISGETIVQLSQPNIIDQFLNILHLGNGCLTAFTLGGVIFSLVCTKYKDAPLRNKLIFSISLIVVLFFAGYVSHRFWIINKLQDTPSWLFYCLAISVATYLIIHWLVEKGKANWFNIIKPAGTATLTCYLIPYIVYIPGIGMFSSGFPGIIKCIVFSFLIVGITWILGKIYIKLKI